MSHNYPNLTKLIMGKNIRVYMGDDVIKLSQTRQQLAFASREYGQRFYGWLDPRTAEFKPSRQCGSVQIAALEKLEREGLTAICEYGKLQGFCCICGRQLTDEYSVKYGIGPICAAKVGFEPPSEVESLELEFATVPQCLIPFTVNREEIEQIPVGEATDLGSQLTDLLQEAYIQMLRVQNQIRYTGSFQHTLARLRDTIAERSNREPQAVQEDFENIARSMIE